MIGTPSVLADEGGDDVDVVVSMPDGGPAAGGAVARIDAGGGEHAAGDVGPLDVGQRAVAGGGAYRAVPDVVRRALIGVQELEGLVEDLLERGQGRVLVAARVGGGAVVGGYEVRIDVLFLGALAVEVVE
jgi:hypothetical protein